MKQYIVLTEDAEKIEKKSRRGQEKGAKTKMHNHTHKLTNTYE